MKQQQQSKTLRLRILNPDIEFTFRGLEIHGTADEGDLGTRDDPPMAAHCDDWEIVGIEEDGDLIAMLPAEVLAFGAEAEIEAGRLPARVQAWIEAHWGSDISEAADDEVQA